MPEQDDAKCVERCVRRRESALDVVTELTERFIAYGSTSPSNPQPPSTDTVSREEADCVFKALFIATRDTRRALHNLEPTIYMHAGHSYIGKMLTDTLFLEQPSTKPIVPEWFWDKPTAVVLPPPPTPPVEVEAPATPPSEDEQERKARLLRLQRRAVVISKEELYDVTAFYFEGAMKVREGVSKRHECAVQLGVVSIFFISVEEQTVLLEAKLQDVVAVASRGNDIVLSRAEADPISITVVMPNERTTLLKCLYLRFEGKGVAFPEEIYSHHTEPSQSGLLDTSHASPEVHPFGANKENELAASYYGSLKFGEHSVSSPPRGGAGGGSASLQPPGVSILPKSTAPLRAALSILNQLEDGNGPPSSPLRRISPYNADVLYAPGSPSGEKLLRYQSAVKTYPDAFKKGKTYYNPHGAGSVLNDFLRSTASDTAVPVVAEAGESSGEYIRNCHLRSELRGLQRDAADMEAKLNGSVRSSAPSSAVQKTPNDRGFDISIDPAEANTRKTDKERRENPSSAAVAALIPPSPRISPVQRLASRDKERFLSALALSASPQTPLVSLPDSDLESLDVASLLKAAHDLPPAHSARDLPLLTKRRQEMGKE